MARVSAESVTARRDPVDPSWVDAIDAGDDHTAASLYLRAKRDANDRAMPAGARQKATHAMHRIRERFPDAHNVAATAADHELGIDDDPDLKRVRDQHRAEQGVTADSAARARQRAGGGSSDRTQRRQGGHGSGRAGGQRSGRDPRPAAGRRRAATPPRVVRRIGREAVRTSGAGSFADLAVTALGATIAFAVGYAILTNADRAARGGAAVELFAKSVGSGITLFLNPVDPLAPRDPVQRTVHTLSRTPSRPTRRTTP
jgi:hypothetical protein